MSKLLVRFKHVSFSFTDVEKIPSFANFKTHKQTYDFLKATTFLSRSSSWFLPLHYRNLWLMFFDKRLKKQKVKLYNQTWLTLMISLSNLSEIHTPNNPIKIWKQLSKVNLKGKLVKWKNKNKRAIKILQKPRSKS